MVNPPQPDSGTRTTSREVRSTGVATAALPPLPMKVASRHLLVFDLGATLAEVARFADPWCPRGDWLLRLGRPGVVESCGARILISGQPLHGPLSCSWWPSPSPPSQPSSLLVAEVVDDGSRLVLRPGRRRVPPPCLPVRSDMCACGSTCRSMTCRCSSTNSRSKPPSRARVYSLARGEWRAAAGTGRLKHRLACFDGVVPQVMKTRSGVWVARSGRKTCGSQPVPAGTRGFGDVLCGWCRAGRCHLPSRVPRGSGWRAGRTARPAGVVRRRWPGGR